MTWFRRLASMQGVSRDTIKTTAAVSVVGTLAALYQAWPAWAVVGMAVVPWFLPLLAQVRWLGEHYGWFALFYLVVVTQVGHYLEHVVQFVQNHALGQGLAASGVITVLNIEWVHFGWNTAVFLAVAALLWRFRRNPWLWATFLVALWHQVEHTYTIVMLVRTGMEGHSLLGVGGRLGITLPITGQDLHHVYNTVETLPLIAAFVYQLRRTHDTWLECAFPALDAGGLARATRVSRRRAFEPGDVIVREGQGSDAVYVVARGEVEVDGAASVILGPGQYFGETALLDAPVRTATVRGRTPGELVELDAAVFREIVEESPQVAEDLRQIALHRSNL